MATAPFTVVGKIIAPLPASLTTTEVYLRNMHGEELEVAYDSDWENNGLFTVNAANFNHNPIIDDYLTIYAIDEIGMGGTGYRKTYNFKVEITPQFLPPITLEYYDLVPPIIHAIYFLEGEYTNKRDNHLILDVEGAHSMVFTGDIVYPIPSERILFDGQIAVKLTSVDAVKSLHIYFYDLNNNMAEGSVSIVYDTVPPFITNLYASDLDEITIVFNEPIRKDGAELLTNYAISGLIVKSATLMDDKRTVILKTNRMFAIRYNMEIRNIMDLAGNVMNDAYISFEGYPYAGFDWTDLDLEADVNWIRKIHLDELRLYGGMKDVEPPAGGWTNPVIVASETDILFEHWDELKKQINKTYINRYGTSIMWTSGPLVMDKTFLSVRHIKEFRAVIDAM